MGRNLVLRDQVESTRAGGQVVELSPLVRKRLRRLRRRLAWQRAGAALAGVAALPMTLLALLTAVTLIPLPARTAALGAAWAARISVARTMRGSSATIGWHELAATEVGFSGLLLPAQRRHRVRLVLSRTAASGTTVLGSVIMKAARVFDAQPTSLPALFAQLHLTPRPATRYTIAVSSGSATLASATITVTR